MATKRSTKAPAKSASKRVIGSRTERSTQRSTQPSIELATQPQPQSAQLTGPMMPSISPEVLQDLQARYLAQLQQVLTVGQAHAPVTPDKRFANPLWNSMPLLSVTRSLYEANAVFLTGMTDAIQADPQTKARLKFATQQWIDAASPTNFLLTNPDAQQKMLDTQGESLRRGMENLMGDVSKGRISQSDEQAFEVGRNLAVTPGAVVFENDFFQLIQYTPITKKVGKRPLLMVPPCINKFYILDLQPENSLVAYAVSQGQTVFVLSWRNPGESLGQATWDDYLEKGALAAIGVVQEISGQKQINTLGFCVGGTILASALAVLAAKGEHPAASMTLLTTLLDFSEPGVLGIFIDEDQVQKREQTLGKGGLLPGKELASTFSALRPNDLVWNYVINNYMMGEKPAAFDLLFWNADSTNLPGPMYAWYLRHLYLQNELKQPGKLSCLGQKIDLGKIQCPIFIYGSKDDHIVPWEAAYASTQYLSAPKTFVLGASGHIAGVINPAAKNKRSHWVSSAAPKVSEQQVFPRSAQAWFSEAQEQPGSWWSVWSRWLGGFDGGQHPSGALGSSKYKPIEPAPGRYVKVRAEEAS